MKRKVRAIIIQDGAVLLIHRIKHDREYYVFPGGSVEDTDENDFTALMRECREELGVDVLVKDLVITSKFEVNGEPQCEKFYSCVITGGKLGTGDGPEFQEGSKYKGMYVLCWVSPDHFDGKDIQPSEVAMLIREKM